ncbi:MAG: DPP IV N-terminal domain-containing protein [Bacteroidales bacterium]|nr:DPP IV N-terminal domain-containing protein [Bacteroidales bacterium]
MKKCLFALMVLCGLAASSAQAQDINVTPSPDGRMEAFTRDNDLWIRSLPDSVEVRLTFDGSDLILNGYASWVYYEEIFGRASRYRAFWWSPDSRRLGFYRFDNSQVPMFPIYSPFGQDGKLLQTRYPKAGEANPSVRIGIIEARAGAQPVWADFDDSSEQYFGTPFWGADSRELYVSREPRRQNRLDLYAVSVADGTKRQVYHEEYPTWVEWIEGMIFTDKGLYMARNFETGWEQIYFLGYDGTLRRLTEGENWDISLLRVDDRKGDVWFTAKRDSRLHTALYRLDRKGRITALTDPAYNAAGVRIAEDGRTFQAMLSTARDPMRMVEGRTDKYDVREIEMPRRDGGLPAAAPAEGPRAMPQVVKIEHDGFDLYGLMTLPKDFDPSRKYPVQMQLYGGPGTPYVRDRWGDRDASDPWCFDNGVIYIVVDPRSSGENGRRGMDQAFRRMTVIELQDYVAWAKWLQSLPYVEGSRIGVKGFSFGGTTTAMLVLRYPQYFRCGIAGGGVYDWHLYDSHYTERFMDTPQANPDGYAEASVMTWVTKVFEGNGPKPLPGALCLTHGTGDDNVHFQNTLQLIDALQQAGYQFELRIYPDGMHGYRGKQHQHDAAAEAIFWEKWLLAKPATTD